MQTFLNLDNSDNEIIYSSENNTVIQSLEKRIKYLIIYGSNKSGKTTIAKSSFFQNVLNKKWGYQSQHMRNMLFKNNGPELPFNEIGQYSGVYQTDWSWSPLFADLDYDGQKDLLITNGFPRDITDMDFANYLLCCARYHLTLTINLKHKS